MRLVAAGPMKEVYSAENVVKAFGQKGQLLEEAFFTNESFY